VTAFKGLQHCFKTFSSLIPAVLAAILNLTEIKINFALDKTTTDRTCQTRNYNLTLLGSGVN
jgi:hypothetical protein